MASDNTWQTPRPEEQEEKFLTGQEEIPIWTDAIKGLLTINKQAGTAFQHRTDL